MTGSENFRQSKTDLQLHRSPAKLGLQDKISEWSKIRCLSTWPGLLWSLLLELPLLLLLQLPRWPQSRYQVPETYRYCTVCTLLQNFSIFTLVKALCKCTAVNEGSNILKLVLGVIPSLLPTTHPFLSMSAILLNSTLHSLSSSVLMSIFQVSVAVRSLATVKPHVPLIKVISWKIVSLTNIFWESELFAFQVPCWCSCGCCNLTAWTCGCPGIAWQTYFFLINCHWIIIIGDIFLL